MLGSFAFRLDFAPPLELVLLACIGIACLGLIGWGLVARWA